MNYLDWLYHRYNEYSLIRLRELNFDHNQANTNCFTTEAYLSSQYEGIVRYLRESEGPESERRSRWSDPKIFFPSFRLPSRHELTLSEKIISKGFKPYKPEKFLDFWSSYFIEVRNDTLILNLDRHGVTETKISSPGKIMEMKFPSGHNEYTLDQEINKGLTSIIDIYKELGQDVIPNADIDPERLPVKDNLGYMQFVIIGEDNNCNPVYLNRIKYEREVKPAEFTIFRFAMNSKRN